MIQRSGVQILTIPQPPMVRSQDRNILCALWVGGAYFLSPVNHRNMIQSQTTFPSEWVIPPLWYDRDRELAETKFG